VVSLACAIIIGGACYGVHLSNYETVDTGCELYFVSVKEGGEEACSQLVSWDGGAGYLYEGGVVVTVCFEEGEALSIRDQIAKKYPSVVVKKLTDGEVQTNRFYKAREVLKIRQIYNLLQSFSAVADDLDEGLTQEGAKRRLTAIKTCFSTLGKANEQEEKVSSLCFFACNWIEEKEDGTLYSRDVRACACRLAEMFLDFSCSLGI